MTYHTRQEIVAEFMFIVDNYLQQDEYSNDIEEVIADIGVFRYVSDNEAEYAEEYFNGSTVAELTEFIISAPSGWAVSDVYDHCYHVA